MTSEVLKIIHKYFRPKSHNPEIYNEIWSELPAAILTDAAQIDELPQISKDELIYQFWLCNPGWTQQEIGHRFGITKQTVSRILSEMLKEKMQK